eukprot:gene50700-67872_t
MIIPKGTMSASMISLNLAPDLLKKKGELKGKHVFSFQDFTSFYVEVPG